MGLDSESLRDYAATLGLHDRPEPDCYLPTESEIRIATAEIRMGWSQAEREARLNGRPCDKLE